MAEPETLGAETAEVDTAEIDVIEPDTAEIDAVEEDTPEIDIVEPDSADPPAAAETRDAFPHTRRPLPWLLAAFTALMFFVPIESAEVKIHLPVDSRIDRFAAVGLVAAWLMIGGDQRAFVRTARSKVWATAACVFFAVATASFVADAPRIVNLGDFQLAEKRFALLGSFLVVGWFAMSALRFEDVRGFAGYLIGLATAMSLGMLIERQTGYNIFYEWSRTLLGPVATVEPSPTVIHPAWGTEGRVNVVGPTQHGLAATAMLVMAMPFALVRLLDPGAKRTRALNGAAFALMVAGAMATDRKTALLVPVAVVAYIAVYRPRRVLRMAPVGLAALAIMVHFASPGAIGTTLAIGEAVNSTSTTHRVGDFTALTPDILAHPIIGRGYGSLNPQQPSQFRINDNEYLDELWQVGAVGLVAFVWLILAPVFVAHRAIRARPDTPAASLVLAASAGCVAFLAACALFDALSFAQAPYMFFTVAAITTIAACGPDGNVEPARAINSSPSAVRRRRTGLRPCTGR